MRNFGYGTRRLLLPTHSDYYLLQCISPVLALGVFHCGAQNFDAIGGTTDIDRPPASIASEAYGVVLAELLLKRGSGYDRLCEKVEIAKTRRMIFLRSVKNNRAQESSRR